MRYRDIMPPAMLTESEIEIDGLPGPIKVTDRQLLQIIRSPRYKVRGASDGSGNYNLWITPASPSGMLVHSNKAGRGRLVHLYYDPKKAALVPYHEDPEIALGRQVPELKDGFSTTIEPLGGKVMYRGMSSEEWSHIQETGEVWSNGSGNIGPDQIGVTYWTTEIDSAVMYAHGFAPIEHKAAPGFPAYVIAAPLVTEFKRVEGTAAHEIGVESPVPVSDLLAVWEGRVWHFEAPDVFLRQEWHGGWNTGGISHPRARLEWKRIK